MFPRANIHSSRRLQVKHLGIDAARSAAKKIEDAHFEPDKTDLNGPKKGEHDDKEHSGGNKWAGGVRFLFNIVETKG